MRVTDVVVLTATSRGEVLRLAGALAEHSEHPVARALVAAARAAAEAHGTAPDPEKVGGDGVVVGSAQALGITTSPRGLAGQVRTAHSGPHLSHRVLVGHPDWVRSELHGASTPSGAVPEAPDCCVAVAWNGQIQAVVVLAETV